MACRPSPPQGGRLDIRPAFANYRRCKGCSGTRTANLPLEGEMAGRPEGGAS
ncbi:propionyl-coenzyme A carboxylase alpha polypeptide [Mesorhizobium sp. M4B.F.Ca.ET.058.02.1.1]|nr:propionyl-coenzyme A carboxylase alpha polypeptide [Mesorhizobium sp. M4B.F.Ca.ET.058.02.1.1]